MSTSLTDRDKTSLSVRIPKRLKSQAVSAAQALHVSMTAFVTESIEKAVRETEQIPAQSGNRLSVRKSASAVSKTQWHLQNERRIALIVQERDHGLTIEEQAELAHLQEEASRYVNQVLPLPIDALMESEELTRQELHRA